MKLGQLIYKSREKKNLTQQQLADAINTTAQYLSNIERGVSPMEARKMKRASEFLDVPLSKMINAATQDYRKKLIEKMN